MTTDDDVREDEGVNKREDSFVCGLSVGRISTKSAG